MRLLRRIRKIVFFRLSGAEETSPGCGPASLESAEERSEERRGAPPGPHYNGRRASEQEHGCVTERGGMAGSLSILLLADLPPPPSPCRLSRHGSDLRNRISVAATIAPSSENSCRHRRSVLEVLIVHCWPCEECRLCCALGGRDGGRAGTARRLPASFIANFS